MHFVTVAEWVFSVLTMKTATIELLYSNAVCNWCGENALNIFNKIAADIFFPSEYLCSESICNSCKDTIAAITNLWILQ